MISTHWLTKVTGLWTILLLAVTACTQPPTSGDSQTNATPVAPTAPANNSDSNTIDPTQALDLDDAAEKVEDRLDNHPTLRAFDLDANDEDNAIVLTGRVQTASQKQLAQTLAQEVAPGVSIVNQIGF
jgi:BON domain